MSQILPEVQSPFLAPSIRPRTDLPSPLREQALQRIRTLSHYIPGYDYQPGKYRYTEMYTTDPDYVVLDVTMMSPSRQHGEVLDQFGNALKILKPPATSDVHISREVSIIGIPREFFATPRNTGALQPDLSLWAGPPPTGPHHTYHYELHGVPLLVVEVVSHSGRDIRNNDWHSKRFAYARMGIREYWILDEEQEDPLCGFTLDTPDGIVCGLHQYRLIEADEDGGIDSLVLGVTLRWADRNLQCWSAVQDTWLNIQDIPIMQSQREGRREGQREGRREGIVEGELKTWGRILHRLLDSAAPGAADKVLTAWTEAPPRSWPSDAVLDQLEVAPHAWYELLLEPPTTEDESA